MIARAQSYSLSIIFPIEFPYLRPSTVRRRAPAPNKPGKPVKNLRALEIENLRLLDAWSTDYFARGLMSESITLRECEAILRSAKVFGTALLDNGMKIRSSRNHDARLSENKHDSSNFVTTLFDSEGLLREEEAIDSQVLTFGYVEYYIVAQGDWSALPVLALVSLYRKVYTLQDVAWRTDITSQPLVKAIVSIKDIEEVVGYVSSFVAASGADNVEHSVEVARWIIRKPPPCSTSGVVEDVEEGEEGI